MITNEMKAKIAAMYLGCKVRYADCTWDLRGIDTNEILDTVTISNPNDGEDWTVTNDLDNIQLILTPLSEITDEDAIEVSKIIGGLPTDEVIVRDTKSAVMIYSPHNDGGMLSTDGRLVINYKDFEIYWYSDGNVHEPDSNRCLQIIDFLRSKSYALPYMGIDLFEAGIAIPNNKNL